MDLACTPGAALSHIGPRRFPSASSSFLPSPAFQACRTDLPQPAIQFSSGGTFQIALTPKGYFNGGNPGVNEAIAIDPQTGQPAAVSLINLLGTSAVVLRAHVKGVPFTSAFQLTPTADGSPGGEKRWLFDSTGTDFGANFSQSLQVTQVRVYSAANAWTSRLPTIPFCYVQLQRQRGARCDSNCSAANAGDCSADLIPGSSESGCQNIQATPAFANGGPAAWVIGFDTPNAPNSRCPVPSGPIWIHFTVFHIP